MALGASAFCLARLSISPHPARRFPGARLPSPTAISAKLNLSSSKALSTSPPVHHQPPGPVIVPSPKTSTFTVFAAKGFKMKTHKASAKRFRVTGKGKIVRRRAGKQHLLAKKSTKRKLRLSKMLTVDKSDYNNIIGALPYLKVNREAS
ncbi:50S ribosomal protein L35, chloroplastic [Apostasia shenzhenica]|uniref:50S ribosomal protein L35 n=1 Tax=Apostasia shenzhenica TaxID=1088818 RepID=A0A2I0BCF3_9ASPA|nr:50S ribosomal protein L35, chloroplastic [Apostasia shenzhenica]